MYDAHISQSARVSSVPIMPALPCNQAVRVHRLDFDPWPPSTAAVSYRSGCLAAVAARHRLSADSSYRAVPRRRRRRCRNHPCGPERRPRGPWNSRPPGPPAGPLSYPHAKIRAPERGLAIAQRSHQPDERSGLGSINVNLWHLRASTWALELTRAYIQTRAVPGAATGRQMHRNDDYYYHQCDEGDDFHDFPFSAVDEYLLNLV